MTMMPPTQGVWTRPIESATIPPMVAPSAMPMLKAAMLSAYATSTAAGTYFSANWTIYN